ncbi:hypothetical protein U3A55_13950 [Salarchaeum sp. III]|uniref:hypothetical protein n=1 Tax=Salarchaeum sp. III TaxID=3107927 RepID=UPI002EDA8C93
MKPHLDNWRPTVSVADDARYARAKRLKRVLWWGDAALTVLALVLSIPSLVGVLLFVLLAVSVTKLEHRHVTDAVAAADHVEARVNEHDSAADLKAENDRRYRE